MIDWVCPDSNCLRPLGECYHWLPETMCMRTFAESVSNRLLRRGSRREYAASRAVKAVREALRLRGDDPRFWSITWTVHVFPDGVELLDFEVRDLDAITLLGKLVS